MCEEKISRKITARWKKILGFYIIYEVFYKIWNKAFAEAYQSFKSFQHWLLFFTVLQIKTKKACYEHSNCLGGRLIPYNALIDR